MWPYDTVHAELCFAVQQMICYHNQNKSRTCLIQIIMQEMVNGFDSILYTQHYAFSNITI